MPHAAHSDIESLAHPNKSAKCNLLTAFRVVLLTRRSRNHPVRLSTNMQTSLGPRVLQYCTVDIAMLNIICLY